jgi:uncharacterized membrane protein HdeD (DUF308 family)
MSNGTVIIDDLAKSAAKLISRIGMMTCLLAVAVLFLGVTAPLYFDKFIAILIMIGGLARIFVWSAMRRQAGHYWPLVSGMAWTAFGTWALISSGGLVALALLMIVTFIIEGIFKAMAAASMEKLNIPLLVLGLVDMLIGGLLYIQWPVDAAAAIPFLVAINLMSTGVLLLQSASAIRGGKIQMDPGAISDAKD